jgi:hypothetical protein
MQAAIETVKTIGVILAAGGIAVAVAWPLAWLIVPPQKGEGIK